MGRSEKSLGLLEALTLGIGTMIGAGIFVLSGTAAGMAGPAAILSFAGGGIAVLFTALCCAELVTGLPKAGGPYAFVYEAFGPFPGFITGWSLWVGLSLTTAFYIKGFALYLMYFLPWLPWRWISLMLVFLLTLLHLTGTRQTARLQNILVLVLLALLGSYIACGIPRVDHRLHQPFAPYGWAPVLTASSITFISFLGFELISTAAEQMRNPTRNLPLATVGSVVSVILMYCLIIYVATGIVNYADLGLSSTPIADTAFLLWGRVGASLIVLAGLLATLSSANGSSMAALHVAYAMGRDVFIFPAPTGTAPEDSTPPSIVLLTAAIMIPALLLGQTEWLAEAAGFLHLYPFILMDLAAISLRQKKTYHPVFLLPGGMLIPLLGITFCLLLVFQVDGRTVMYALCLLVPGVVLYAISSLSGRISPPA